jgi:hypothetical protein
MELLETHITSLAEHQDDDDDDRAAHAAALQLRRYALSIQNELVVVQMQMEVFAQ